MEDESSVVDISNKEASTIYEIYRILSNENYDLGKSVKDFVKNFRAKNSAIDKSYSEVPNQMEEILNFIEECSQNFHCYYNLGDKNMPGNKIQYSKPAVEKFIFNKVYNILYELYNKKYEKENEEFLKKQDLIKKNLDYNAIMEFLEVSMHLF